MYRRPDPLNTMRPMNATGTHLRRPPVMRIVMRTLQPSGRRFPATTPFAHDHSCWAEYPLNKVQSMHRSTMRQYLLTIIPQHAYSTLRIILFTGLKYACTDSSLANRSARRQRGIRWLLMHGKHLLKLLLLQHQRTCSRCFSKFHTLTCADDSVASRFYLDSKTK